MITARFILDPHNISCTNVADFVLNQYRSNRNSLSFNVNAFDVVEYESCKWLAIFGEFPAELDRLFDNTEYIDLVYFDEHSPYLHYCHVKNSQIIRRIQKSTYSFDQERIDANVGAVEPWEEGIPNIPMGKMFDIITKHFGLIIPDSNLKTELRTKCISININAFSFFQKALNLLRYGFKTKIVQIHMNDSSKEFNSKRAKNISSTNSNYLFLYEENSLVKEIHETLYG